MRDFYKELMESASYYGDPALVDAAIHVKKLEELFDSIWNILNPTTYGDSIGGYHYMFGRLENLLKEHRGN